MPIIRYVASPPTALRTKTKKTAVWMIVGDNRRIVRHGITLAELARELGMLEPWEKFEE